MESFASKELKDMYKLVLTMLAKNESVVFREPVDWKTLGLPDYPEIVKNPMDLGTVKTNLETGKYENAEQVAADIRLVWTNCMLYNRNGSEFYHVAEKFSRVFEDAYKAIRQLDDMSRDPHRVPTLEEKLQLSHDVFKIGNNELARVLSLIERSNPSAIARRVLTDEMLVNFDALSPECFHEVNSFVLSCIAQMQATKKTPGGNLKKRKSDAQEATNKTDNEKNDTVVPTVTTVDN